MIKYSGKPNWEPLERVIGPDRCSGFYYMGHVDAQNTTIFLYKHKNTRRYLNINIEGKTWRFELNDSRPRIGVYVPLPQEEAIRRVIN